MISKLLIPSNSKFTNQIVLSPGVSNPTSASASTIPKQQLQSRRQPRGIQPRRNSNPPSLRGGPRITQTGVELAQQKVVAATAGTHAYSCLLQKSCKFMPSGALTSAALPARTQRSRTGDEKKDREGLEEGREAPDLARP